MGPPTKIIQLSASLEEAGEIHVHFSGESPSGLRSSGVGPALGPLSPSLSFTQGSSAEDEAIISVLGRDDRSGSRDGGGARSAGRQLGPHGHAEGALTREAGRRWGSIPVVFGLRKILTPWRPD